MKKFFKLILMFGCMTISSVNAQVGMQNNNPNKDAVLDLNMTGGASTKGLLLPKVELTAVNSALPMTANVAGMHIWNTATTGSGINAVTPGEYFNDGTKWVRVSSSAEAWLQDGNINGTLKAIGTNDPFDLPIETNGVEKMRVTSGGQVLVNTTSSLTGGASAKLQINNGTTAGAIQIKDGTEGAGKILTSDTNGVASWKAPASQYSILGTIPGGAISVPIYTGNTTFYTGCYIDLPKGQWNITATVWFEAVGSNLISPSRDNKGFMAFFFSTSDVVVAPPGYATAIKSILINPINFGGSVAVQASGTGSIPVILNVASRIYVWGFVDSSSFSVLPASPTPAAASVFSHNGRAGTYGPYTQLYATPINF